jgi:hypothetical protein
MDRVCSKHGKEGEYIQTFGETRKRRDDKEGLGLHGMITINESWRSRIHRYKLNLSAVR